MLIFVDYFSRFYCEVRFKGKFDDDCYYVNIWRNVNIVCDKEFRIVNWVLDGFFKEWIWISLLKLIIYKDIIDIYDL